MRALILDEKAAIDVANVTEYADKNRLPFDEIKKRFAAKGPCVGNTPQHCCYFHQGYKCVYSVEEQEIGWTKHLSVSIAAVDRLPHMEAVKMIAGVFGLKPIEECHIYIEESIPKSVNLICEY